MRKRTFFRGCLASAFAASLAVLPVSAEAKNDFDALLADIDFGGTPQAVETTNAPAASEPLLETSGSDSPEPPQSAAEPLQVPTESIPMSTQAVPQPYATPAPVHMSSSAAAVGAGACGHANCGGHGCKKHLGKRITEGYCLPYTPPQVPTSTFYQYWRTNACNVNVWDGFRNRCPSHIDMSINKKHGCMHGKCGDAYQSGAAACGDCGPPPSEWLRGGADCDSCQ